MKINTAETGFFFHSVWYHIFSIGWTPCVGVFLGSALMLAAQSGESVKGVLMLLCFSLGLGIPFLISAVLIGKLKSAFDFIKRNYRIINIISGGLLVIIGILMATGLMGRLSFRLRKTMNSKTKQYPDYICVIFSWCLFCVQRFCKSSRTPAIHNHRAGAAEQRCTA